MKLITSEEQLRAHLPNMIATVKGEMPFIDRLASYLTTAEEWVRSTFTSDSTFNTICGYSDTNPIKPITEKLVVMEALRMAIPALDIVLTPNGFGVVSTSNLAPASKSRVDRLLQEVVKQRDECIAALLPKLHEARKWINSSQCYFFYSSLFPDLDIVDAVGLGTATNKWDRYLELRPQIIDLEDSLAEEWFSPELMETLRRAEVTGHSFVDGQKLIRMIKAQIIDYIKNGSFSTRKLADALNIIRNNKYAYREWHNSETAKLFSPPKFVNKKEAKGYWF